MRSASREKENGRLMESAGFGKAFCGHMWLLRLHRSRKHQKGERDLTFQQDPKSPSPEKHGDIEGRHNQGNCLCNVCLTDHQNCSSSLERSSKFIWYCDKIFDPSA